MAITNVLRCWESCKTSDHYQPLTDSIKKSIQSGNNLHDFSDPSDLKALTSLLSSAFTIDQLPKGVQNSIIEWLSFLGSDVTMRFRLVHSFGLLKNLFYALTSSDLDKLKLLSLLQLYTSDLRHYASSSTATNAELLACGVKTGLRMLHSLNDDRGSCSNQLELVLGLLANLFCLTTTDRFKQSLANKDDFAALRACLLQIMNSDRVSTASLIYCLSIRFHLWQAGDKFFEKNHIHNTIRVLFNALLNGDICQSGFCAGQLLADLCGNTITLTGLCEFPDLQKCIEETIVQLKSKNPALILKLIQLLTCLIKAPDDRTTVNGSVDEALDSIRQFILDLILYKRQPVESSAKLCNPLITLFSIASGSNELTGTAVSGFLLQLIKCHASQASPPDFVPFCLLLEQISDCLYKVSHQASPTHGCQPPKKPRSQISISRILQLQSLTRLASELVDQLQHPASYQQPSSDPSALADTVLLSSSTPNDLVDKIGSLVEVVGQLAQRQLETDSLLAQLLTGIARLEEADQQQPTIVDRGDDDDPNGCLISLALVLEFGGLLHSCIHAIACLLPPGLLSQQSQTQQDEVSLTQENDPPGISPLVKLYQQCGQALQLLLNQSTMPAMLAVGLAGNSVSTNLGGIGLPTRLAAINLTNAALSYSSFDPDRLAACIDRIQSTTTTSGHDISTTLDHLVASYCTPELCQSSSSFLSQWFASPVYSTNRRPQSRSTNQQLGGALFPVASADVGMDCQRHSSDFDRLVSACVKKKEEFPVDASDALNLFESRIKLLQSRESVLEASVRANAEAVVNAHKLVDHYQQRASLAESDCDKYRAMQLTAVARLESDCRAFATLRADFDKTKEQNSKLVTQLEIKNKDCEDLTGRNDSLTSELATLRDKNRALNATIDNFRIQLDQSKEQIQNQMTKIAKFTQMTRLINDLTGNPDTEVTSIGRSLTVSSNNGESLTNGDGRVVNQSVDCVANKEVPKMSTRRSRR